MKLYKVIINELNRDKHGELIEAPDEAEFMGKTVKRGHAIFFRSAEDLTQNDVVAVMEQIDELPEYDLFGDKIVIYEAA